MTIPNQASSPAIQLRELRGALESALETIAQADDSGLFSLSALGREEVEKAQALLLACPPESLATLERLAEIGRRVEGMPDGFSLDHHSPDGWEAYSYHPKGLGIGKGKTALEALRAAGIGGSAHA